MTRRTVAAALAGLAALATAVAGPGAAPAGAQPDPDHLWQNLAGNFVGGPADELFHWDNQGSDELVAFSNGGVPGGGLSWQTYPFTVPYNLYQALVGDFDGDDHDEIFWYGYGDQPDYRWDFTSPSSATPTPFTVGYGGYSPVAGDFLGDGVDDILWYAPGSAADHLWDFNPGGGYTSRPQQIGGNYTPLAGSFGSDATDDVLWWGRGTTPDYLWDMHPDGGHTSVGQTINGSDYRPFTLDIYNQGAGGGDVFWYLPGGGTDYVWNFVGGQRSQLVQNVNATYTPAAGNLLGDGCDDVYWGGHGFNLWDYSCTPGGGARRYIYDRTA